MWRMIPKNCVAILVNILYETFFALSANIFYPRATLRIPEFLIVSFWNDLHHPANSDKMAIPRKMKPLKLWATAWKIFMLFLYSPNFLGTKKLNVFLFSFSWKKNWDQSPQKILRNVLHFLTFSHTFIPPLDILETNSRRKKKFCSLN